MSRRAKFVFITWIGPGVSVLKKAKVSTDKAFVKAVWPVSLRVALRRLRLGFPARAVLVIPAQACRRRVMSNCYVCAGRNNTLCSFEANVIMFCSPSLPEEFWKGGFGRREGRAKAREDLEDLRSGQWSGVRHRKVEAVASRPESHRENSPTFLVLICARPFLKLCYSYH